MNSKICALPNPIVLYRVRTETLVGDWNVAGDDGPPDAILGWPVEILEVRPVAELCDACAEGRKP